MANKFLNNCEFQFMKHKVILLAILIIFSVPVYERGEAYFEKPSFQGEIINVTVNEVWEMLNNESDGIQFVVDVRTFKEYFNERIATPHLYDLNLPVSRLRKGDIGEANTSL